MQHEIDAALRKELLETQRTLGWMDLVLGSISEAVYVIDDAGRIVFSNQYFAQLVETPRVLLLGMTLTDIFKIIKKSPRKSNGVGSNIPLSNSDNVYEWNKNGSLRLFEVTSTELSTTKQTVYLARDITKDQQITDMKNSFINLASHQLRTPMTSIMLHSHMLKDMQSDDVDSQQKLLTDGIIRASERMIHLINDILNITKIQNDISPKVTTELIDLSEILQSIYDEVASKIIEKKLEYTVNLASRLPDLYVNKAAVQEIISNLIVNAIQYTPAKGNINVSVSTTDNSIIIIVKDSGIGVPMEAVPHIFEQFWRADNAFEVYNEGTGLGLYLVHMLTTRIGGKIRCQSVIEKGTTFTVELPLTREPVSLTPD